jgi:hypothetical protein
VADEQKSVVLTFILSMFPGVGHYYLGLMNRGLQFMLLFIGGIVIGSSLDLPELGAIMPVVWFYALFDALQMAGAINLGENVDDKPVIPWNRVLLGQKTIGWALIIIGVLLIAKRILPSLVPEIYSNVNFRTAIISILLIVAGIRILKPSMSKPVSSNTADDANGAFTDETHINGVVDKTYGEKREVSGE